MRYFPGTIVTFKQPANGTALVVATREQTVTPGIGQIQTKLSELEILKADGTTGWYNEDCFL